MSEHDIHQDYVLYIGAGAVATGGIISLFQALPLIFGSLALGLRDLRQADASRIARRQADRPRPVAARRRRRLAACWCS